MHSESGTGTQSNGCLYIPEEAGYRAVTLCLCASYQVLPWLCFCGSPGLEEAHRPEQTLQVPTTPWRQAQHDNITPGQVHKRSLNGLYHPMQEEGLAREADARTMLLDQKAALGEYVGHRNHDHLSSRSPDDIEEVLHRTGCCYSIHTPRI